MSIFSRINKLDDQIAEQNYHRLYYEARKGTTCWCMEAIPVSLPAPEEFRENILKKKKRVAKDNVKLDSLISEAIVIRDLMMKAKNIEEMKKLKLKYRQLLKEFSRNLDEEK